MEEVTHIDYDYQHAKRFKLGRFLPFVIYLQPKKVPKEKEERKKLFTDLLLDDKKIKLAKISHKGTAKDGIYIYIGIFAFFSLLIPIWELLEEDTMDTIYLIIVFCIGLPFLIPAYKNWKKYKLAPDQTYITFDRINSLITMPKANRIDKFTIPFTHLRATRRAMMHSKYSYTGPQLQFFIDTRPWRPWHDEDYLTMSHPPKEPKINWSFYVWYMDKNRPLPPGSAFDEFREADYKRRKAEGFPPPLFKSLIPTPEATAEQQLVRETFWKDEDFIPTKKETYFSISPFSKHYKSSMSGELKEDSFDE
ncbi:hypothetical protein [Aquimarina longa]|uniref:hypothetical protein n=1 Tax=Aquimarina longa TaxID=1080221 RepID=UPI000785BEC4|nr:hypothetical protein [Aquimarina longa]